jgi:VIT1/CCC1 family predicted Fe2+/Mn2+ transporter
LVAASEEVASVVVVGASVAVVGAAVGSSSGDDATAKMTSVAATPRNAITTAAGLILALN